mmetsp:Transcript_6910/g.20737  ORF Transcript_6910/g.20737 Transcript_6910/m.20737 type:complete len:324 (-) Transcript_6910:353-1324(-)
MMVIGRRIGAMTPLNSFVLFLSALGISGAFVVKPGFAPPPTTTTSGKQPRLFRPSIASGSVSPSSSSAEDVKAAIMEDIRPTKRGLSTTAEQRARIEGRISTLEGMCPVEAPARDSRMGGHWFVRYTTAPPPSNGQLGPFVGVAEQEIGMTNGKYANILNVGPNNWLGATLEADWTEWDGKLLEEKDEEGRKKWMEGAAETAEEAVAGGDGGVSAPSAETTTASKEGAGSGSIFDSLLSALSGGSGEQKKSAAPDFGATSWRVAFDSLTISLFGIPIFTKNFEDTERVWKMTYIDDDTRVVRAGRTGKSEDDVVFYMTRQFDE